MAAHQAPPSLGFSRQEHWSRLLFPSPMHETEKWNWSHSVMSDPQQPHGLQPSRLLYPWDFPGKSTGVRCHCLLQFFFPCSLKYTLTIFNPISQRNDSHLGLKDSWGTEPILSSWPWPSWASRAHLAQCINMETPQISWMNDLASTGNVSFCSINTKLLYWDVLQHSIYGHYSDL